MTSSLYFFIFLTVGLLPSFAHAQIIPVSRLSSVSVGENGNTTSIIESTSFDPFVEMLFGSASSRVVDQDSMFDNQMVSVNTEIGNIGTSFGYQSFIDASSSFRLDFDLPDSSVFQLTGLLTENDIVENGVGFDTGGSFVRIDGPASFDFESTALSDTSLDELLVLPSGRYSLLVGSSGVGSEIEPVADATAEVTFQFVGTAVPEPSSTFVLFATCIPLLVRRKH